MLLLGVGHMETNVAAVHTLFKARIIVRIINVDISI